MKSIVFVTAVVFGSVGLFQEYVSKDKIDSVRANFKFVTNGGTTVIGRSSRYVIAPQLIDIWFDQVKSCTQISAVPNPPKIIISDYLPLSANARPLLGFYYRKTREIRVLDEALVNSAIMKHEMVHYVLDVSGEDWAKNVNHLTEVQQRCYP